MKTVHKNIKPQRPGAAEGNFYEPLKNSIGPGMNERIQKLRKLSFEDKAYYHETLNSMILGTPKQCKEQIKKLAEQYRVDEVMIVNVTYSFEDRKNSYGLLPKFGRVRLEE